MNATPQAPISASVGTQGEGAVSVEREREPLSPPTALAKPAADAYWWCKVCNRWAFQCICSIKEKSVKAKAIGITRPADAAHTLLVTFDRAPTDDDMREAHDALLAKLDPESDQVYAPLRQEHAPLGDGR